MAEPFIVPVGANLGTSLAEDIAMPAGDFDKADPFDESGLTWTELIASTNEDWSGFAVTGIHDAVRTALVHIAKGAAAAESRIATIPLGITREEVFSNFYVPIPVPSGTRLSIAFCVDTTTQFKGQLIGYPSANFDAEPSLTVMDCGPFDLDDYGNLLWEYDPGATANTKGGFQELSLTGGTNRGNNILNGDSLGQDYEYLGIMIGDTLTPQADHGRLWEFARGAAMSEVLLNDEEIFQYVTGAETQNTAGVIWMPWGRSSGDRISVNMQASTNDAGDRVGTAVLFGLR